MRISDWSSDVCSSDLRIKSRRCFFQQFQRHIAAIGPAIDGDRTGIDKGLRLQPARAEHLVLDLDRPHRMIDLILKGAAAVRRSAIVDLEIDRTEEHTSALQSIMRI